MRLTRSLQWAVAVCLSITSISTAQFIANGWTAFGDSFAAGIGAGGNWGTGGGWCRRRVGAYPNRLHLSTRNIFAAANAPPAAWNSVACSGHKIENVVHRADGTGQVDRFLETPANIRDAATISIGGNDAFFADVLDACIFHAKRSDCAVQLERSETAIDTIEDRLVTVYEGILAAAQAGGQAPPRLTLFVVGYPEFFNEVTTGCNTMYMNFWPALPGSRAYLTIALRTSLNNLVKKMNDHIQIAVDRTNAGTGPGAAIFVPISSYFEGHRFCEENVNEPDLHNPNTWFLLMKGDDAEPGGAIVDPPDDFVNEPPTAAECATLNSQSSHSFGEEWGKWMICAIQDRIAQGDEIAPWLNTTGSDFSGSINTPERWAKAFHPKTVGHEVISRAIEDRVNDVRLIQQRVLFMFEGPASLIDDFIATLPRRTRSRTDSIRLSIPNIPLRAYVTWISIQEARIARNQPGVVGYTVEPGEFSILDEPELVEREVPVNNITATFEKRQITANELWLQTDARWHLKALSNPPKFQDTRYYEYPGFLHNPAAGAAVNVYVLDSGVNLQHPAFVSAHNGQNRIPYFHVAPLEGQMIDIAGERQRGHGTCVASLVGSEGDGVTKFGTNIIPVRWEDGTRLGRKRSASLFESLLWILNDVSTKNMRGKAVINFSSGIGRDAFADRDVLSETPAPEEYHQFDIWYFFLPFFEQNDIVVVCSAGNGRESNDLRDIQSPRRHAAAGRPGTNSLIVVGGTGEDGSIWQQQVFNGEVMITIGTNLFSYIVVWAPGSSMLCANAATSGYSEQYGTSLSTPLVSGLIATFLGRTDLAGRFPQGQVAARMKTFVQEVANYHTDGTNSPQVLGTYDYIPCEEQPDKKRKKKRQEEFVRVPIRRQGFPLVHANERCTGMTGMEPRQTVGAYHFESCIKGVEPGPTVTLPNDYREVGDLTECAIFCAAGNYPFFGVAHGKDCYCGAVVVSPVDVDSHECSSVCQNLNTEICGGPRAISLYWNSVTGVAELEGWEYENCYVDSETRTLSGAHITEATMTPSRCASFCGDGGWRFFGVEAGNECWCSNAQPSDSLIANAETCNTQCGGSLSFMCGGGWRLNVYRRLGAIPSQQVLAGWTYDNCYTDDWVRTFPTSNPVSTQLTPSLCASLCVGRRFFGLEAGNECFCGDTIDTTKLATDPTTCNTPCTGQSSFVCGGGWRLSVYRRNPPRIQPVPGWRNESCYLDSETRTLSGASFQSDTMTAVRCAEFCCGWRYMGIQYGVECFCGNTLDASLVAPATDCNVPCAGNDDFQCGGGWRLNVYGDLPDDAPGCSSSCELERSCDLNRCAGSFDLDTGIATCKGAFRGCECNASPITCGTPLSCEMNNCNGTFNADGRASCKGFFAGCECKPTAETCGGVFSCDADHCDGTFDLGDGKAYCTNQRRGCECHSTRATCGTPLSCDLNNCAGTFSMTDGRAYCSNFFEGCPCVTTETTCGNRGSCDANNCDGHFDMGNGRAYCSNFFAGCECNPTPGTCGQSQSCDMNNCWGSFDLGNGQAYCRGFFQGCRCSPTYMTCGEPQSCDSGNCQGFFDLDQGIAFCSNFFYGCRCQATDNTCGAWQSCDMNGCAGSYDANGEARCRNKFAGCRCNPTANTCGNPASCDGNGCNGGWDSQGVARCQGNFAGCPCVPTTNTCGAQQPCANGGCNGRADGSGQGWCQDRYQGCRCIANTVTPGYCGVLTSCSFSGCQGVDVGQQFGRCRHSSHYDCTCVLPPRAAPPPSPLPPPPSTNCVDRCLSIITFMESHASFYNLPSYVCTSNPWFSAYSAPSPNVGTRGGVDWWLAGFSGHGTNACYLSVAKSGHQNGFPDAACFLRSDLEAWVRQNALGCYSGSQFYRATQPQTISRFVGEVQLCLTNGERYTYCGNLNMNGVRAIDG